MTAGDVVVRAPQRPHCAARGKRRRMRGNSIMGCLDKWLLARTDAAHLQPSNACALEPTFSDFNSTNDKAPVPARAQPPTVQVLPGLQM